VSSFGGHGVCFSLQKSFQTGTNVRLDERIFAMCQVKNQPLVHLMLTTHPSLYRVDNLSDEVRLILFFSDFFLKASKLSSPHSSAEMRRGLFVNLVLYILSLCYM
jgi:hypothetical protein